MSKREEMRKLAEGKSEVLKRVTERMAQTNMGTFLEENPGVVPPGLNSLTEYSISVRKPSN